MSTVPARARLGPAYCPGVRDLRWAVAGLVIATTVLTGCAEKQEANTSLPTARAAPTSEALPELGPADFPVPDEARTKDAAGAEAFLRYFIELINRQRGIPAGQPLRDLGPECQECLRIAQNYDEVAAAGSRYVGGELTLNDVPAPVLSDDGAAISFGARREPVSVLDSNGEVVDARPEPAPNLGSGIDLVWSNENQSWLVTGFNLG